MIFISKCGDRFEELVQFVARHNSDGEHHIGFFGEGEADVRTSLAECLVPSAEGFFMAFDGDNLIGVFGVDIDPEISRAWLYGPLIEHVDWQAIADGLYREVLVLIPADIRDYDLFCDQQNNRLQEFSARHEFPLHSENAVLTLVREIYTPSAKRQAQVIEYQEGFFEQFEALHKTLFPNAYFTAQQIIEKQNDTHTLFLAVEHGRLLGYHFCKIELESKSGYVDFIGTDKLARRCGIGADLLAAGVDWMLSVPTTEKIELTVNTDNVPARRLYERFGFTTGRVMRAYRKRILHGERMS